LVYSFAVAKEFIDEMTGNALSKEKQNSIYKDKLREIKASSKFTKAFKGKLLKLPITITVDNPMISLGVAWGRKPYTDFANASTPVAYDIFVKADPLFKITGSLDLITCATFLPVAGQVIEVVRIVLEVAGAEPVFKISASGKIAVNGKGTIHDDAQSKNNHSIDPVVIATVKLMVEASITAKAGLVGFIFSGGDYKGLVTDTTVNAKAEVGFDATFGQGVNFSMGPYFKAQLGFLGLIAVGKKESKTKLGGSEKELFRYTIIKPNPDLLGGTYYFNKD